MADVASVTGKRLLWSALQFLLLGALLVLIAREVVTQADALRAIAASIKIRWWLILAASAIVLATYAALIQSWRLLMSGWGSSLAFWPAVRIWTIANLGRYVPGKVWSVGALVVLAQREGVSPVAATGAALLGTVINIGAGFGVVALTGASVLDALSPSYRWITWAGSMLFIAGVFALPTLLPRFVAWLSKWRPSLSPPSHELSRRAIWLAVLINCSSWIGYGAAFALLANAVFPDVGGALPTFIAIWTASYLVGYLVLIAPGGIGAREAALVGAMVALGLAVSAEATVLAAISRLWLIALEVAPGLISITFAPAVRRLRP